MIASLAVLVLVGMGFGAAFAQGDNVGPITDTVAQRPSHFKMDCPKRLVAQDGIVTFRSHPTSDMILVFLDMVEGRYAPFGGDRVREIPAGDTLSLTAWVYDDNCHDMGANMCPSGSVADVCSYRYIAYLKGSDELLEGNSPPRIIVRTTPGAGIAQPDENEEFALPCGVIKARVTLQGRAPQTVGGDDGGSEETYIWTIERIDDEGIEIEEYSPVLGLETVVELREGRYEVRLWHDGVSSSPRTFRVIEGCDE